MNKNEIIYERTISTSYMKIPALENENMDVRIMLQRDINGMLPVERCHIDGKGEYWYNISGKQALDSYTKMHALEYPVFEHIILRICEQLEILEWNLLDGNGLMVDPELIFLNNKGEDISFVFYPHSGRDILKDIQTLMEYLLSKLSHSNHEAIKVAYELYEMTLCENYQVQKLKDTILKYRIEKSRQDKITLEVEPSKVAEREAVYRCEEHVVEKKESYLQEQIEEKLSALCKKAKQILVKHPKEEIPTVIYPQEEEEQLEVTSHPTICIAASLGEPRGVLIFEGIGNYPDFELDKTLCVIGKSSRAKLQISRETISNFHAKIEYMDGYVIEDMNSTNGTFVNDEILNYREKRVLNAGDVIRFADVKYRFL